MKRPYHDYSGFSLRRLNEPRFSHLKLILGWVFYFSMYFITENLIPAEACHPIHCALDDLIPFNEYFAVFYVGWYFYVFGMLLFYLLHDGECFRGLSRYILTTQVLAMLCYIVYPSRQDLRPEVFARDNILLGVVSTVWKDKLMPRAWSLALSLFALGVCAAVCFVKQHSALDVAAALPVCLAAELVAYGRSWWLPRLKQ